MQKEATRREEQKGRKKALFIVLSWEDGQMERGAKTHEDQLGGLWLMPSKDATLQGGLQARQLGVLSSRRL